MLLKFVLVGVLLSGAGAQLEQGVLAALYYPAPAPPARGSPRPPSRTPRSYFDRDSAPREGNDAALRRVLHQMADPRWTPDVRPRSPWI